MVEVDGGGCQTSLETAAPPRGELRCDHSPAHHLVKYANFLCCPSSIKRNSQQEWDTWPEVLICCHHEEASVLYPLSPPDTSRALGDARGTPAQPAASHSAVRINKFAAVFMETNKDKRLDLNTFFLAFARETG